MDPEKIQTLAHAEDIAVAAQDADHAKSKWQAVKHQPMAIAWIGWALFVLCLQGFDSSAGAQVIGIQQFRKDFGYAYNGNWVIPAEWQSAFSGGPVATAVFGALFASWLRDIIGTKWAICTFLANTFVGVALEFVSTTNAVFFAGKMINGISLGAFNCLCVTYVSEISPLAIRGVVTAMCNMTLALGPLVCVLLTNSYGTLPNVWAYRGIFCAQWGFAVIASIFAPFCPETPYFLVNKGKYENALKSLQKLGLSLEDAEAQLAMIRSTQTKASTETEGATFAECFRGTNRRRTLLTVMPLVVQALSGVSFVGSYSTYYYQLAGNSVARSFQLACGAQALSLSGDITSWFVIDRVGRRTLLIYGVSALTALLLICGGLATSGAPGPITGTVALFMMYNFVYNIVIGSVAYAVIAEIPVTRLRAKTIALALTCQKSIYCLQNFVLPYLFNPDKGNLGAKTMFIFGGFGLLGIVYFWFFQPETARRSFAEIDEMFFNKVPSRKFKTYVTGLETQMAESRLKH